MLAAAAAALAAAVAVAAAAAAAAAAADATVSTDVAVDATKLMLRTLIFNPFSPRGRHYIAKYPNSSNTAAKTVRMRLKASPTLAGCSLCIIHISLEVTFIAQ